MDSSLPAILRVPNEVLFEIISLVVPSIWPKSHHTIPCPFLTNSPFHAIRSTCRIFRWTVDELPFWRADDFNIADVELFNRTPDSYYVNVLISDPHVQQCLGRKTGWRIENAFIFRSLERHISHFGRCVRYLNLNTTGDKYELELTIPTILHDAFPMLMVLELKSRYHVHYHMLPPSLRRLQLEAPLERNCDCENHLPNLEQLCCMGPMHRLLDFKRMLPFNSKNSLAEFRCQLPIPICGLDSIPDFELLHQFRNLTALHTTSGVAPLKFYESLLKSPLRLKTFESTTPPLSPVTVNALLNLLRSPVLHNLQHLIIHFSGCVDTYIQENPIYERFLCVIVNLPDLENLQLDYFPLHSDWIQLFQKSERLRSVQWLYISFKPLERGGEYKIEQLEERLVNLLSRSRDKPPNVSIRSLDFESDYSEGSDGSDLDLSNNEEYSEYEYYEEEYNSDEDFDEEEGLDGVGGEDYNVGE
jgi:hypothetical protein